MPKIPLVGPSYTPFSIAAAEQSSINCYVESIETNAAGKNKWVLRGRPGMRLFKDLTTIDAGATAVRSVWSGGGRLFVVAGNKFFEVTSSGALVGSVWTISNALGYPAFIIPNSNQLLIVNDGKVYCDNGIGPVQVTFSALSGQATTIGKLMLRELTPNGSTGNTDPFDNGMIGQTITYNAVAYTVAAVINQDMLYLTTSAGIQSFQDWSCTPILSAYTGAFVDGYYLVPRVGTRQFNMSAHLDGSTWDPLDSELKEGYPDNLQAIWSEPPILYLLGTETLELWRDVGSQVVNGVATFPFERIDGGFARVGLAATWSCASIMGNLHMLAGGSYGQTVAVRMDGATPVRISTHAVEEALKGKAFPTAGVAYSYVDRGHWFWVLNFTGASSWVYDATESARTGEPQWHERAGLTAGVDSQYVPHYHTFIPEWGTSGKHIVGDAASGKLYEMSSDYFDDDSTNIRARRSLAYVYTDGKRSYHQRIEIELETGTAATPPVVTLDWSDDRGQTFGTGAGAGTTMTLGPGVAGTYTTRYFAAGLGSSRGRVYRISILGQGRVALIDAVLEAVEGSS